jgi:aminoglycoside phosphotransferase family enzyme
LTVDDPGPTLAEKVAFLGSRESFPEHTTRVQIVETHMSFVFLTDEHAYKLKKPVRFKLLNLATLEDRKRNCEAELAGNRRLAPGVYLGAVPLGMSESGGLVFDRGSRIVDWLVKMRRLPAERMLDHLISRGRVHPADVRRVAETLAAFYRQAARSGMGEEEYGRRFVEDIEEIGRELGALSPIPKARIQAVRDSLLGFVAHPSRTLGARARESRIVDAHGDLRPEHVCLLEQPVVIDFLEFAASLRLLDPADELSFLAVECEIAGGPAFIEPVLFETYSELTGDRPAPALRRFYQAYRAFLRAKITIWHLTDPVIADPEKWISRTGGYLRAAERILHGIPP